VSGIAGPPVLLLHGLTGSGRYWGRTYESFAVRHRLIVPDLLGFGASAGAAGPFDLDSHISAVAGCLDALGVTDPVTIGAHSMGTVIALGLARTQPHRVRSIAAFGPPVYPSQASARRHVAAGGLLERLFVLPGPVAKATCSWMCNHRSAARRIAPWLSPTLPRSIAQDATDHTWPSYSQSLTSLLLANPASDWIDDVTCPLTLVAGQDDRVLDLPHLERLTQGDATLQVWPGDHHLPLRSPERCCDLIASQLQDS